MARSSEVLDNNRDILVRLIEVPKALSWLTHNKVLDDDDKEVITNCSLTRGARADELINTVMRRESRGCDLLMELIEYEYPQIFEKIQGRQARSCPTDYVQWEKQQPRISQIYKEGLDNIRQAYEQSRQMNRKAESIIKSLQDKIETVEKDLNMKKEQITILFQETFELKQYNKKLEEQLQEQSRYLKEQEETKCGMLEEHEAVKETVAPMKRTCSEMTRRPLNKTPSSNNPGILACDTEELKKERIYITKLENDKSELLEEIKHLNDQLKRQQAEHEEEIKQMRSEMEEMRHQIIFQSEKNMKPHVNEHKVIEMQPKKCFNVMTNKQKEKPRIVDQLISSLPVALTCLESSPTSEGEKQEAKPSSDKKGINMQTKSYGRSGSMIGEDGCGSSVPPVLRSISSDVYKRQERTVKGSGQFWKSDSTDH